MTPSSPKAATIARDQDYYEAEKAKAKDPGFGGLVWVMNKRNEFLWGHP